VIVSSTPFAKVSTKIFLKGGDGFIMDDNENSNESVTTKSTIGIILGLIGLLAWAVIGIKVYIIGVYISDFGWMLVVGSGSGVLLLVAKLLLKDEFGESEESDESED